MRNKFATASAITIPTNHMLQFEEEPIRMGLILTGGGSHGAYEAGVLEAILPELQRIGAISVISGTSAGAVNAVAAGSGLNASGVEEATQRLRDTWKTVTSNGNMFSRGLRFFSDAFLPKNQKWPNLPAMPFNPVEIFQAFMPSFVAPFISTTVKNIVGDWKAEVQDGAVKIVVNTMLEDKHQLGKFEHVLLSGKDLTPDGVGASANLKQLGVHYIGDTTNPDLKGRRAYDGAYQENGPFQPHLDNNVTDYIMIVLHDRRHNKLDEEGELKHAEIHSNALDLASHDSHTPVRLHAIEIETMGGEIGNLPHMDDSSKLNTNSEFIDLLYLAGIKAGKEWLAKNSQYIGQMSSYSFYPPALEQLSEAHYT